VIYEVDIVRYEKWQKTIRVESQDRDLAIEEVQKALDEQGWDAVVQPDDEGDYAECRYAVPSASVSKDQSRDKVVELPHG
jgi:hypothetical protein